MNIVKKLMRKMKFCKMTVTYVANKCAGYRRSRKWKVNKEQNDHKLKVLTVGYSSGGLMKEEIITFTIMWDLPNFQEE